MEWYIREKTEKVLKVKELLKRDDVTKEMIEPYFTPLSAADLAYIHNKDVLEFPEEAQYTDEELKQIDKLMEYGLFKADSSEIPCSEQRRSK